MQSTYKYHLQYFECFMHLRKEYHKSLSLLTDLSCVAYVATCERTIVSISVRFLTSPMTKERGKTTTPLTLFCITAHFQIAHVNPYETFKGMIDQIIDVMKYHGMPQCNSCTQWTTIDIQTGAIPVFYLNCVIHMCTRSKTHIFTCFVDSAYRQPSHVLPISGVVLCDEPSKVPPGIPQYSDDIGRRRHCRCDQNFDRTTSLDTILHLFRCKTKMYDGYTLSCGAKVRSDAQLFDIHFLCCSMEGKLYMPFFNQK